MIEVVGIRFKKAGKMYYFDPAGIKLEKEDGAIVERREELNMAQSSRATALCRRRPLFRR